MKRRIGILLLVLLLLTGCASKEPTERGEAPPAETRSGGTVTAAVPEVENNGGYYVRVGDRVYFRRYGANALNQGAVYGEFTKEWNINLTAESELMAYDPAAGDLKAMFTATGGGPLWYGDGGLYLHEWVNSRSVVVWHPLDGGAPEEVCDGTLLGVTDSGLLAVERSVEDPSFHLEYAFYRNRETLGTADTDENTILAGMTDEGVFLLGCSYTDKGAVQVTLWQFTPDGKELNLGMLPASEDEPMFYDVQADGFLAAEGKVTVEVGFYAGTGHFLDDFACMQAEIGKENSLQLVKPENASIEEGALPKPALGADGGVTYVPALEGELRVDWNDRGTLKLWENGAWQTLSEQLAPAPEDGWGFQKLEQHMDYVDGAAYLTVACAEKAPADAVGWREAYALLHMLYWKVDRDGTVTELTAVDHGAELYGNVWLIEGESVLLWQQLSTTDGEGYFAGSGVYAIPIAEDAYWEGGWEKVFDGTTGLLPYDYGEGKADYYGYPAPDTEPAGALCLELDRDGTVVSLSRKDPEAVMGIDFDVPVAELKGAAATLDPDRRDSDEDTPRFWARLRVLENGVRVRLERTAAQQNVMEAIASQNGAFVPGETLYDAVLNRGDFVAVKVSLPWHPELRVVVSKNGGWGSYAFGEDNGLHLETETSVHPEMTLAAYPMPSRYDTGERGMLNALAGTWLYRSPITGRTAALLQFDTDGSMILTSGDEARTCTLAAKPGHLFADEYSSPDTIELTAEAPETVSRIGYAGSAGDYLVELYRTEGEELLHLSQVNNGDGALEFLLPDADGPWTYDYVFTRGSGTAEPGARHRAASFAATVAKFDADAGVYWLREMEIAAEPEVDGPSYSVNRNSPCLAYPAGSVKLPENSRDPVRPMQVYNVTTNADGEIVKLVPFLPVG